MVSRVKFDLEYFIKMSDKLEELSKELITLDKDLRKSMEILRVSWDTPCGREFFESQAMEWSRQIYAYVNVLETLQEMVDYAKTEYQEIENCARSLSINK